MIETIDGASHDSTTRCYRQVIAISFGTKKLNEKWQKLGKTGILPFKNNLIIIGRNHTLKN